MNSPVIFAGALTIFAGALPPWAPPGNGVVSEGRLKKSGPVLNRLWTKVHEIFGQCRRLYVLSGTLVRLSIGLYHVSFRRYLPSSLEVVEKPNKCKLFGPQFFSGRTTPTFLRHIVSAT